MEYQNNGIDWDSDFSFYPDTAHFKKLFFR